MMTVSGHISAQKAQPVQAFFSLISAIGYPERLTRELIPRIFLGQAMMQSPHPLHRSSLKVTFGIIDD
jgi:hypothetical protein